MVSLQKKALPYMDLIFCWRETDDKCIHIYGEGMRERQEVISVIKKIQHGKSYGVVGTIFAGCSRKFL